MAYLHKALHYANKDSRETKSLLSVNSSDRLEEYTPQEVEGLTNSAQLHTAVHVGISGSNPTDDGELVGCVSDSEKKEGTTRHYGACNDSTLPQSMDGSQFYQNDKERTKYEDAALYIREGEDNDKFDIHPTGVWSRRAFQVLHHPAFHVFHLCVCTLYLLLALIEEPSAVPHESGPAGTVVLVFGTLLDIFVLATLWLDMVFRFIWFRPRHFFTHKRTMFILLILVVMSIDMIVVHIVAVVSTYHYPVHLKVLRAFRPIFLIDTHLMGGVRRVLRQILLCVRPILDVLFLMMLVLVVFSLVGYLIFAEIDPTYFISFSKSLVSFFITMTTSNHPDVILEAYDRHPLSPLFFVIYVIVMVYLVTNVLLAVVYSAFKEADKKKFEKLFIHKIEALRRAFDELKNPTGEGVRFHDFLLFMHFYLPRVPEWQVMCIFKAMHSDPEQEHKELSLEEFYRFYEVRDYKWKLMSDDGEDLMWFVHRQTHRYIFIKTVAKSTYGVVKSKLFDSFISVVIIANILFLTIYTLFITEEEVQDRYYRLNNVVGVSFGFVSFYILEICLKIFATGPIYYFKKSRNMIDALIIFTSFVLLIIEASSPAYAYLAVFRPIKFFRLLRLKRSYRDIMRSITILSYRLFSIGVLLVVIYFSFAIIGIEYFSGAVKEGCCNESWFDVGVYYSGNNHTFGTHVYYILNFDNILNSYLTLFVLMVVNNWYILMEGFASTTQNHWLARLYFMIFFIITLVVLQVVISFIVDAFETGMLVVKEGRGGFRSQSQDQVYHKSKKHKKITTIKLLALDIQKLKEEVASSDKRRSYRLNRFIKRFRSIKLDSLSETPLIVTGRRLKTKDDLHGEIYKENIPIWIKEQEENMNKIGFGKLTLKKLYGFIIKCLEFIVQ